MPYNFPQRAAVAAQMKRGKSYLMSKLSTLLSGGRPKRKRSKKKRPQTRLKGYEKLRGVLTRGRTSSVGAERSPASLGRDTGRILGGLRSTYRSPYSSTRRSK